MSNNQSRAGSGVLIRVKDLKTQRYFYRDILKLGEPSVDSDFWVEFSAPDGSRIILEKSEASYLEHLASATTLVLSTPHLNEIRQVMCSHKYHISEELKLHPGEAFYRGEDPEGNIFYLCNE